MAFKIAFFVLRLLTAIAALAGLVGTLYVIFIDVTINLFQNTARFFVALGTALASAFRKTPDVKPVDLAVPPTVLGVGVMFVLMFVSVFVPGQRVFLHVVATMAAIAGLLEVWKVSTVPTAHTAYLPIVVLWFIYYAVCLRRA